MGSSERGPRAILTRLRTVIACAVIFTLAMGVFASTKRVHAAKAAWKIVAIRAKSFDQATGQLEDVISSSANSPLKWVLVIVELKGDTDPAYAPLRAISLTASEHGRTVFSKTTTPRKFRSTDGRFSVPFWIEGERCEPLKLTATVKGVTAMTKTVGYSCGE